MNIYILLKGCCKFYCINHQLSFLQIEKWVIFIIIYYKLLILIQKVCVWTKGVPLNNIKGFVKNAIAQVRLDDFVLVKVLSNVQKSMSSTPTL